MPIFDKNCRKCEQEFSTSYRTQVLCSSCKQQERRNSNGIIEQRYELNCVICDSKFKAASRKAKICSLACKQKVDTDRRAKKRGPTINTIKCAICEKLFDRYNANTVVCSKACHKKHLEFTSDQRNKIEHNDHEDGKDVRCIQCKRQFRARSYGHKFCTFNCLNNWSRRFANPWLIYKKCGECGAEKTEPCRDENDDEMNFPCEGRKCEKT